MSRKSKSARPRPKAGGNATAARPAPKTVVRLTEPKTETELRAQVAQRVRKTRAQRFMTRKQLARHSGISLAYLARIESGTGNISLGLLHKLAAALNLPIESFLAPEDMQNADFALILEFLKRQGPKHLAHIRRLLLDKFGPASSGDTQRIALIGMRGVGKSTLGPLLAERLGIPFVELSREIQREAGVAVTEIFNLYGQQGYRQLERRCLERAIVAHPKMVLATGGGIVATPGTYELMLSSFYTIWLKGKPEALFARVMAQHDARIASPKLRREALEGMARTMDARRHLYDLAHASFDTSGKTVEQVVRAVLAMLPVPTQAAVYRYSDAVSRRGRY